MKDEEMAEEIANKRCHEFMCYGHCSFNSPEYHGCGGWHREYDCALKGIKAGRHDEQLTKAKEIIKEFVFLLTHTRTALDTKTVMQKAEQFLKEE
jgi:hypothetical protein